jgi:hypothetical protein
VVSLLASGSRSHGKCDGLVPVAKRRQPAPIAVDVLEEDQSGRRLNEPPTRADTFETIFASRRWNLDQACCRPLIVPPPKVGLAGVQTRCRQHGPNAYESTQHEADNGCDASHIDLPLSKTPARYKTPPLVLWFAFTLKQFL